MSMSVFNVNYSQTRIAMPPIHIRSASTHPSHACRPCSSDHMRHGHMVGGPMGVICKPHKLATSELVHRAQEVPDRQYRRIATQSGRRALRGSAVHNPAGQGAACLRVEEQGRPATLCHHPSMPVYVGQLGVCVCMHMCYVDCTRAPPYDRPTGVHFAL